ncbi:MAG: hypothetical protein WA182_13890 [Candidatus Sulfotelmatobacter sp.]
MTTNRFIYAYKEKVTGTPIYVGSAKDPAKRDAEHCKSLRFPFDKELRRRGRDSFTFEIVEAFRIAGSTLDAIKASVPRENQWMDVLGTFRTPHGFNFARARVNFSSQEAADAARIASGRAAGRTNKQRAIERRNRSVKQEPQIQEILAAHWVYDPDASFDELVETIRSPFCLTQAFSAQCVCRFFDVPPEWLEFRVFDPYRRNHIERCRAIRGLDVGWWLDPEADGGRPL